MKTFYLTSTGGAASTRGRRINPLRERHYGRVAEGDRELTGNFRDFACLKQHWSPRPRPGGWHSREAGHAARTGPDGIPRSGWPGPAQSTTCGPGPAVARSWRPTRRRRSPGRGTARAIETSARPVGSAPGTTRRRRNTNRRGDRRRRRPACPVVRPGRRTDRQRSPEAAASGWSHVRPPTRGPVAAGRSV